MDVLSWIVLAWVSPLKLRKWSKKFIEPEGISLRSEARIQNLSNCIKTHRNPIKGWRRYGSCPRPTTSQLFLCLAISSLGQPRRRYSDSEWSHTQRASIKVAYQHWWQWYSSKAGAEGFAGLDWGGYLQIQKKSSFGGWILILWLERPLLLWEIVIFICLD